MLRLRRMIAALRRWLSRGRAERDLHDEIQSYAGMIAAEQEAAGVSHTEARRRALVELGGIAQVEESVRQSRSGTLVEQTLQDIRYALRGLRRTPGFTAVVVLTVGLGIGLTTAVFAVMNTALFRPLPYERPDELVEIGHVFNEGTADGAMTFGMSWDELRLWRQQTEIFEAVEAHDLTLPPLDWRETGRILRLGRFTTGLPRLLGLAPKLGRTFTAEENDAAAPVILLSDALWRAAFAARVNVLDETLSLDGTKYRVIGVMPEAFRYGPAGGARIDAWTTRPERAISGASDEQTMAVGRLRPRLTLDTANARAAGAARGIQAEAPSAGSFGSEWKPRLSTVDSWRRKNMSATVMKPLSFLLLSGAIVLLIACANVANLLGARSVGRRNELTTRAALGDSRTRLARLLAAEGLALTGIIAIVGAVIAWVALKTVHAVMPRELALQLAAVADPGFDWRVGLVMVGLLCLVMLLSSVSPAIRYSRARLVPAASGPVGESRERRRLAFVLQSIQVALALVLVVGAALAARSLWSILSTDVGFDHGHLVTVVSHLSEDRYRSAEARGAAAARLLETVRALPGVGQAAFGPLPASNAGSFYFEIAGREPVRGVSLSVRWSVGPGYFETARIPVLDGREFGSGDTLGAPPVVIIDRATARRFFGDTSPLGERVRIDSRMPFATIIGVVDVVFTTMFPTTTAPLGMYLPYSQMPPNARPSLVIRARADAPALAAVVRDALKTVEPDLRILAAEAADSTFERAETYLRPRFTLALVLTGAAAALVTAAIGLFGLLSYAVAQRRREIGLRLALGASISSIRRLILGEALRPVVVGLGLGVAAAGLLSRYVDSMLYGVTSRDPLTLLLSGAALLAAALVATIGPVRNASAIDPAGALKSE